MKALMPLIWPKNKIVVVVDAGESGPPRNASALLKEQNLLNDSSTASCIAKYSWVIFYTF